jgi:uncharacterized protein
MSEKSKRGFGLLTPEDIRELGRRGGQAAQRRGTAHRWDVEEAKAAGLLGQAASRARRGSSGPAEPGTGDGAAA